MTRDVYNIGKAGAVGPGAQNIEQAAPAPSPEPTRQPPKPSRLWMWAGGAVAAGLAITASAWALRGGIEGSNALTIAGAESPAPSGPSPAPVQLLASAQTKAAKGPRLALVIAQTDYTAGLTDITLADSEADQIEAALSATGFVTTRESNLTRDALSDALDAFRRALEEAGPDAIGFVYYTGHGTQHPKSGDSYLLGTNARLNAASDLPIYGLDMQTQSDAFAATGAKAVFLVFDACRNVIGPSGWKAGKKGIGRVEAMADMLIAYSTSADDVAEEGVYAPVLAEELSRAGQTAETAFAAAQRRVAQATGREQMPYTSNKLYNEICFASCPGEMPATVPAIPLPTDASSTDDDFEYSPLTDEQSRIRSNGFGEAAMAKVVAEEATQAESTARAAAYRVESGGQGCQSVAYKGDCDDAVFGRHGVEIYGGASQGEAFYGRFEKGIRAIGKFQHEAKAAEPRSVRYYLGQFSATHANARGNWNGHGIVEYQDGSIYAGQVRDGQKHGFGECTFPDGVVVYARWQQDVRKETLATNALGDIITASSPVCGSD